MRRDGSRALRRILRVRAAAAPRRPTESVQPAAAGADTVAMESPATGPDPRWCVGLPFVDSAPFTEAEAAAVARRSRHFLLGTVATGLLVPALFVAAWGDVQRAGGIVNTFALALDVVIVVFVLPVLLLLLAAFTLRWRSLRCDAIGGEVAVFRGEVRPRTPNRIRDRIERTARARLPREGALEVRVLPHSRQWLHPEAAGDRFDFLRVRIQRAAPPPEYAWRVPVHRDLGVIPAPGVVLEQRQLTALERVELESYERALRRPDVRLSIGFATCTLLMWLGTRRGPQGGDPILFVSAVILLALHSRTWFRRWALAARMKVDLNGGRVLSAATEKDEESSPARTDVVASEFLPMSRMLWVDRGRPAAWREAGRTLRAAA